MKEALLTAQDAIEFLGLDRQGLRHPRESLRWLCRSGRLKYAKIGRHIRFRQAWLDECVEQNSILRQETQSDPIGRAVGRREKT